jgi:hypothetical protein
LQKLSTRQLFIGSLPRSLKTGAFPFTGKWRLGRFQYIFLAFAGFDLRFGKFQHLFEVAVEKTKPVIVFASIKIRPLQGRRYAGKFSVACDNFGC